GDPAGVVDRRRGPALPAYPERRLGPRVRPGRKALPLGGGGRAPRRGRSGVVLPARRRRPLPRKGSRQGSRRLGELAPPRLGLTPALSHLCVGGATRSAPEKADSSSGRPRPARGTGRASRSPGRRPSAAPP